MFHFVKGSFISLMIAKIQIMQMPKLKPPITSVGKCTPTQTLLKPTSSIKQLKRLINDIFNGLFFTYLQTKYINNPYATMLIVLCPEGKLEFPASINLISIGGRGL